MRYATAGAFRAALEQRLSSIADETGVPLLRLRKLIVFDRLMARLTVAADRFGLQLENFQQVKLGRLICQRTSR